MLLIHPLRGVRLLSLGPRLAARTLLRPRFGTLRTAIVLLGIAATIAYFARNRRATSRL